MLRGNTARGELLQGWLFFDELCPVDGVFVQPGAAFEVGAVVEVVLGRFFGNCVWAGEGNLLCDQFEGDVVVLFHIGPEVEYSLRLEGADDIVQKIFVEHSATAMTFFPPGVGEVNVHTSKGIVGDEFPEESQPVAMHGNGVVQFVLGQASRSIAGVFEGDFNPQVAAIGMVRSGVLQKEAFATADFNFEGTVSFKQCCGGARVGQLFDGAQVEGEIEVGIDFSECASAHDRNWQSELPELRGACSGLQV